MGNFDTHYRSLDILDALFLDFWLVKLTWDKFARCLPHSQGHEVGHFDDQIFKDHGFQLHLIVLNVDFLFFLFVVAPAIGVLFDVA